MEDIVLVRFLYIEHVTSINIHFFFPIDTGRKLNVHKTLRRRPGCLLNVLCTFNLRPKSTGLEFFKCLTAVNICFTSGVLILITYTNICKRRRNTWQYYVEVFCGYIKKQKKRFLGLSLKTLTENGII